MPQVLGLESRVRRTRIPFGGEGGGAVNAHLTMCSAFNVRLGPMHAVISHAFEGRCSSVGNIHAVASGVPGSDCSHLDTVWAPRTQSQHLGPIAPTPQNAAPQGASKRHCGGLSVERSNVLASGLPVVRLWPSSGAAVKRPDGPAA